MELSSITNVSNDGIYLSLQIFQFKFVDIDTLNEVEYLIKNLIYFRAHLITSEDFKIKEDVPQIGGTKEHYRDRCRELETIAIQFQQLFFAEREKNQCLMKEFMNFTEEARTTIADLKDKIRNLIQKKEEHCSNDKPQNLSSISSPAKKKTVERSPFQHSRSVSYAKTKTQELETPTKFRHKSEIRKSNEKMSIKFSKLLTPDLHNHTDDLERDDKTREAALTHRVLAVRTRHSSRVSSGSDSREFSSIKSSRRGTTGRTSANSTSKPEELLKQTKDKKSRAYSFSDKMSFFRLLSEPSEDNSTKERDNIENISPNNPTQHDQGLLLSTKGRLKTSKKATISEDVTSISNIDPKQVVEQHSETVHKDRPSLHRRSLIFPLNARFSSSNVMLDDSASPQSDRKERRLFSSKYTNARMSARSSTGQPNQGKQLVRYQSTQNVSLPSVNNPPNDRNSARSFWN